VNDAAITFFRSRGYTGTYNDAFRKYLIDLTGDTTGTIDDLLSKILSMYSGSIADKILSYGRDKNYLGTFNDVIIQIWLGGGFQWTPAAFGSNLVLWLDATDASTITLNGSNVSQWNDKSGNARHVSQSTAVNQPQYEATGLNGRPTFNWGSAINNKGLRNDAVSNFNPTRYFIVAEYDGSDPFNEYAGLVAHNFIANPDVVMTQNTGTGWFAGTSFFHNGATSATTTALPTISQPFVAASNFAQSANRTNLFVGNDRFLPGLTRGWRGKISEVIAIDYVPSVAERNRAEGYLAWKWGLEANLPAGHPFKNTPPTL
jgi:hypothetical protein